MSMKTDELSEEIRNLENELDRKYEEQDRLLSAHHATSGKNFDAGTIATHQKKRSGLVPYFLNLPLRVHLTSPFVYGMVIPFAFLDICVIIYQAICFWAWKIPKIRRGDHVVIDRHHLAYLNGIEKLNCVFCGYANGVISFTKHVSERTEEYWCPIKHASRINDARPKYREYAEFGDADTWKDKSKFPDFWQ